MVNQLKSQVQRESGGTLSLKRQRELLRGLERFVNTDGSEKEYLALAKGWPAFWPADIQDGQAGLLEWPREGHALFLAYRETLRVLWRSDPVAVRYGALSHLLGVSSGLDSAFQGSQVPAFPDIELAVEKLRRAYPMVRVGVQPVRWPDWQKRIWTYRPKNDFQAAVELLWKQQWRAKVCPQCKVYFVAEKKRQTYCSPECGYEAHKTTAREWAKQDRAKSLGRRKSKGASR